MTLSRINRLAKLTGLSTHVIRAWERRYDFINPVRGPNRYRQYSDEDVALFRFLKHETDKGYAIGDLAALGREELLGRARTEASASPKTDPPLGKLLDELTAAILSHNHVTFERRLNGAISVIPFEEALKKILLPLQERVGELWHEGKVGIAWEHYVTRQVQQKLFAVMNQMRVLDHGPNIVIACPPREFHEIGSQTIAYISAARGCRTRYLGADIPIADLEVFCTQIRPDLTLLSLTIPPTALEAEALARELSLRLTPLCGIGVGGSGIQGLKDIFVRENIQVFDSLTDLEIRLLTLSPWSPHHDTTEPNNQQLASS